MYSEKRIHIILSLAELYQTLISLFEVLIK